MVGSSEFDFSRITLNPAAAWPLLRLVFGTSKHFRAPCPFKNVAVKWELFTPTNFTHVTHTLSREAISKPRGTEGYVAMYNLNIPVLPLKTRKQANPAQLTILLSLHNQLLAFHFALRVRER